MSKYFIVEVKDKHITRHEIFLALVEKLGLGVVVTVEPASQQSVQSDDYWRCAKCQEYNPSNQGFCSGCGETRRR